MTATTGAPDRDLLVGIDVGGTKVATLVVAGDDVVVGRAVRPVAAAPGSELVDTLAASVRDAVAAIPDGVERIAALGVAIPGRVQPASGHVRQAVNLGWIDEALGPRLAASLDRPCVLENDVNAAALGVLRRGGDLAAADMAFLNIGTGIAAGIVLGGQLHRGRHGMAGEVGHVVLDPAGALCNCGLRGCVEALAAGPAIERDAQAALPAGVLASHRDSGGHVASALFAAASAGDPRAVEVADGVAAVVARVVHALVMAYDLDRVVLGGGVSKVGRPLLDRVERALDGYRERSALAREMLGPDVLRLIPPTFDAGCWGAIARADALAVSRRDPAPA